MSKTSKKILITGASGFIGYNACLHYIKKGWQVFGLAKDGDIPQEATAIHIDLLDFDELKRKISEINPDAVFHFGALVVLERNFEVARECVRSNIEGTLNLLEAVRELSIKTFLFLSTAEVYGKNKPPFREDQKLFPPSPYSISKVASESFCKLYHDLYHVPAVIFRISTIYGYYQPVSRFIPTMIIKALKHEDILLNSGKNKRDYLFIEDLLDACDKTIGNKGALGKTINIGLPESTSGKELVRQITKLSGSRSKVVFNAFPDREGEAKEWKINNSAAKKILRWKPKTSLKQGLEKTIDFYKRQLAIN